MKKFLVFILKGIISIVLLAIVLDFAYTLVYVKASNRGKIDHVYNSQGGQYDVVILGSSRANNHFVSEMFEEKGLKTFNFGMSASHLYEADLLLKLMIERKYKIKNLIVEVDLNLSNNRRAEGIAAKFMPYLHQSEVVKEHFKKEVDFNYLYYIPFYRYIKYDSKIGFRELSKVIQQEKTSQLDHKGYRPLDNFKKKKMSNDLVKLKPLAHNQYYENIKRICLEHNIRLIPITTPMCENTKGINYFEKVKKAYPEIHNYENKVVEDYYFSSCGHMNDRGARKFTEIVINDFFSNK